MSRVPVVMVRIHGMSSFVPRVEDRAGAGTPEFSLGGESAGRTIVQSQAPREARPMRRYLRDRWFKFGLILLVLGSGPLWTIVLLAAIGLWPDPNPNPIGPGPLFFFTFWPAVILMGVGVVRVKWSRGQ